jgi:hypothetical protein
MEKSICIPLVLKEAHKIIGVSDDQTVTFSMLFNHFFKPQIQSIVEVNIG